MTANTEWAVNTVLEFAAKWADGTRRDQETFAEAAPLVRALVAGTAAPAAPKPPTPPEQPAAPAQGKDEQGVAPDPVLVAVLLAHRACCGVEADSANGKIHGYCIICGVPWPCEVAQTGIDAARRAASAQPTAGPPDPAAPDLLGLLREAREALRLDVMVHPNRGIGALLTRIDAALDAAKDLVAPAAGRMEEE